ncbi:MAG: hypothetical protein L6Q66_03600 [Bacteroidia bacterium]|nr:hypothetical protein [Bacteroidia bacterium]
MAARFWVPGGNGLTSSSTNWSLSSGGASGASSPGATDDAIFDSNSGVGIVSQTSVTWLSADFTNFAGTWAGTGTLTIAGGNFTLGSGMTITWTGTLQFNATGSIITSNGKEIAGNMLISTGFPSGGTITLNGVFKCAALIHTTISGVVNIDGSDLYLKGGAGAFSTTSGRTLQGTSTIRLVTTAGGLSISHTGVIKNNVVIDATNLITQTSTVTIGGGTWTYISGTWTTGTSPFSIVGDCTLNLAGMQIHRLLTGAAATCTLTSILYVIADVQYSLSTGFIFAGTHGFTCATLTDNATSTARNVTLSAGAEYFVRSSLFLQSGWSGSKPSIVSGTPGTKAKLTIAQGATIDMANGTITDIDCSFGKTLWIYNGTISNCNNVFNLPHSPKTIGTVV